MAHPFFESSRYPWDRPEAGRLFDELVVVVPLASQIRLLYERSGGDAAWLNPALSPGELWSEALRKLAAAGKLERLLTHLKQTAQDNDRFQAAVDAVIDAQPESDWQIVSEGVYVLDRVPLRTLVRTLEADATPLGVLLVRGDSKSGKTRGHYVFHGAARDRGALPVYLSAGFVATVDDVVQELFAAVGASERVPDRGATTVDAWFREACVRLQDAASRREQQLWIAIDDLGHIDPEIRGFCDQFVARMANPAFARWFRLMLIHYPEGPEPTTWMSEVWAEDRTSEADVQFEDVVHFLTAWAASARRTILQPDLEALARAVLEKSDGPAPEPPLPRLRRLHDHLVETLQSQGSPP